MNEFVIYALYSKSHNKIYIGYTSSIIARIKSHNETAVKGFTYRFRPWEVIYVEFTDKKTTALRREKSLKSAKGREFIWSLIQDGSGYKRKSFMASFFYL